MRYLQNHQDLTQINETLTELLIEEVEQEDEVPFLETHNMTREDHPRLIVGDVEDRIFNVIV